MVSVFLLLLPPIFAFPDYVLKPNGGPCFANEKQLFAFIGHVENLPTDPNTLHNLTQDSMQVTMQHPLGRFTVIKAECMGGKFSRIRSFHGNGSYYIVLKDHKKIQIVGFVAGNRCRWDVGENYIKLIFNYHYSAKLNETVYEWNGKIFQQE